MHLTFIPVTFILLTSLPFATAQANTSPNTSDETGFFEDLGKTFDKTAQSLSEQFDEASITAKVLGKYAVHSELGPFKLQVFTTGETVKLAGTLNTAEQFETAIFLAATTPGVEDVNIDKLKLTNTALDRADLNLSALIKVALFEEKIFGHNDPRQWPIAIKVKNNIVTAEGFINDAQQKKHIIDLIEGFDGIEAIEDGIIIKR